MINDNGHTAVDGSESRGGPHDTPEFLTRLRTPHVVAIGLMALTLSAVVGYALRPNLKLEEQRQAAWLANPEAGRRIKSGPGSGMSQLPKYKPAPAFSLTERSGATVTNDDLRGNVWIADFIFTHCAGPCWDMSRQMAELQRQFAGAERFKLVSVSVDSRRDTPAVLSEYADNHKSDPNRWLFLTSDDHVGLRKIITEGFFMTVVDTDPAEREAQGMDAILHSTKFLLIDTQGTVRGMYDYSIAGEIDNLIKDTHELIEAGGR